MQQEKYNFRIDSKIGTKYSNSLYYKGTKLWDKLNNDVQFSDNIHVFKSKIEGQYNKFVKDFIV